MAFAIGYQLAEEDEQSFIDIVKDYRTHISEVYFPWVDIPTGRALLANRRGFVDWSAPATLLSDLREIKKLGIKLDLLLNANCYGKYSLSQYLENKIFSSIDYIQIEVGELDIVTTASPMIAHVIKKHFPNIEVRASVNMRIGTIKGMEYISGLFDSFHLQREFNRDLERIRELSEWADNNGKKLILLANSGCLNFCSWQTFHDNTVAHEIEIDEIKNIENFDPHGCWNYLKAKKNWVSLLQGSWIRPEDLHNYNEIFETVKLATRMHSNPRLVVASYTAEKHHGNLLDLFEPGFSLLFAPRIIDNDSFPQDWFEKTSSCNKKCSTCSYCLEVMGKVLVEV